jgi:hypothetical protein
MMSDESQFESRVRSELAQVRETKESIKAVAKLVLGRPHRLAVAFHAIADAMPQVRRAAAQRPTRAEARAWLLFFFFFLPVSPRSPDADQGADGAAVRVRRHLPARQAERPRVRARRCRVRASK